MARSSASLSVLILVVLGGLCDRAAAQSKQAPQGFDHHEKGVASG